MKHYHFYLNNSEVPVFEYDIYADSPKEAAIKGCIKYKDSKGIHSTKTEISKGLHKCSYDRSGITVQWNSSIMVTNITTGKHSYYVSSI